MAHLSSGKAKRKPSKPCPDFPLFPHARRLIKNPVPYGTEFRRPSKKLMRQARQAEGLKMFEASELGAMLKADADCSGPAKRSPRGGWET